MKKRDVLIILLIVSAPFTLLSLNGVSAIKRIESQLERQREKIQRKWSNVKKWEVESKADFDARKREKIKEEWRTVGKRAAKDASRVTMREITVILGEFNVETKKFIVTVKVPLLKLTYRRKISFGGMEILRIRKKWRNLKSAAQKGKLIGRLLFDAVSNGHTVSLRPYKLIVGIKGREPLFYVPIVRRNENYSIFSLSRASRKAVSNLNVPLKIKVFLTDDLPAPYNNIKKDLQFLVQLYSGNANRYFQYEFLRVRDKSPENREAAQSYGIYPQAVQTVEQDEVTIKKAYMGLVIIQGKMQEAIPSLKTTEGLEYQITSMIDKMNKKRSALLSMNKDDIKVKLFFSDKLRTVGPLLRLQKVDSYINDVKKVTQELDKQHFGRLKFEVIDPTGKEEYKKELTSYQSVLALQWEKMKDPRDGKQIDAGQAHIGLVVRHGDRFRGIRVLNVVNIPKLNVTRYKLVQADDLKEMLPDVIEGVVSKKKQIGYLSGHGTLSRRGRPRFPGMPQQPKQDRENVSNFADSLSQSYSLKDVELKNNIPEGLETLIIAHPTKPFSEYELFQIDQFLMKGKSLAVFMEPFKEGHQGRGQTRYVPLKTGLERLLEHYGVTVKSSYLLDKECHSEPDRTRGGQQEIFFAPRVRRKQINRDFPVLRGLQGLLLLKVSPLELDKERLADNDITPRLLFNSSEQAWETGGRINLNPRFLRPPDEKEMKQYPLSYVLEGTFPSYFAGKGVPERDTSADDDDGKPSEKKVVVSSSANRKIAVTGNVIEKGRSGKIFLLASTEYLKNGLFPSNDDNAGRNPMTKLFSQNRIFTLNVIDYLNGKLDYAQMRGKSLPRRTHIR